MIFERHLALHGFALLGHPDLAHAPFADPLQELVGADESAGGFGNGLIERRTWAGGRNGRKSQVDTRAVQKAIWLVVNAEQGLDLATQGGVSRTGVVQERGPFGRGLIECTQEYVLHASCRVGHGPILRLLLSISATRRPKRSRRQARIAQSPDSGSRSCRARRSIERSVSPFAIDGCARDSKRLAGFLKGHTSKDMQFDDAGCRWIAFGQSSHGLIDGQDGLRLRADWLGHIQQLAPLTVTAEADTLLPAGIFDENPTHGLGGGSEEVAPAVPVLGLLPVHQTKIGLVNQRRGLEGLSRLLMSHLRRRQPRSSS